MFPGEKFGLDQPLAAMRLKTQRNVLQDLALLDHVAKRLGPKALR